MTTTNGPTVAALAQWWLDRAAIRLASHAKIKHDVRKHIIDDPLGAEPVLALAPWRIVEWLTSRRKPSGKPLAPKTLNNLRGYLHAVIETARRYRLVVLDENPVAVVEPQRVPEVQRRILEVDQRTKVVRCGKHSEHWQELIGAAVMHGLRFGELAPLQVSDVHLDRGFVVVSRSWDRDTTKNGKPRIVPIHPSTTWLWARAVARARRNGWHLLWPNPRTGQLRSRSTKAAQRLRAACRRAGVSDVDDIVFHGLRHSWATHAVEAGMQGDLLNEIAGWTDEESAERYKRKRLGALTVEMAKLPGI